MEERRRRIVELVNTMGNVSFAQLKERFSDVSEMTLRTDLKYLDETHQILRVYGGAKSVYSVIGSDDLLSRRRMRNLPQKQAIAKKAVVFLAENRSPRLWFYSHGTRPLYARYADADFCIRGGLFTRTCTVVKARSPSVRWKNE